MTLVLDASAACELLFARLGAPDVEAAMREHLHDVAAPHVLDLEVLSAARRKVAAGEMTLTRAGQVVDDLHDLPLTRFPHDPLASRIWELRANLTPYDAAYVVLAEVLDAAELLTADRRLARAARRHTRVAVATVPQG